MGRKHGRITVDDIKVAGLRRWNGRSRITTDWFHLFQEPELYWPDGDCLVYLREPGQSSRGPAFRIHTSHLVAKGCYSLLDRCVVRTNLNVPTKCVVSNCPGCDRHPPAKELYIPAPHRSGMTATFDHHITTRNFFAWLYHLPLAGRTLGQSLVALKYRLDMYRPDQEMQNQLEVIACAESQKYLDFRECIDHALAALYLAEVLRVEDLWIDAFAHCVGLSHRGIRTSPEYENLSTMSRTLLNEARHEMDIKLDKVSWSVAKFFESDLSVHFLGLPQAARDHFDRFRSFLHTFYIEQHGFWPPENFEEESVQRSVYATMYSDFRSLYLHLADQKSSPLLADTDISGSGGVCMLQNVQAFDARHGFEALPRPLCLLPSLNDTELSFRGRAQRRNSWNPLAKRKVNQDACKARSMQALSDATNRDTSIMSCLLVRRYSEFEADTILDDFEDISLVDGRKVRWILVYVVLQTLVSVLKAPKQVRNTEGLSYSLCCQVPNVKPWGLSVARPVPPTECIYDYGNELVPDTAYSHTNASSSTVGTTTSVENYPRERRQTLPASMSGVSLLRGASSASRSSSLRRMMTKRNRPIADSHPQRRGSFCEIYVQGYGNGLNEVQVEKAAALARSATVARESISTDVKYEAVEVPRRAHSMPRKRASFCEIMIQGYGNGLRDLVVPANLAVGKPASAKAEVPVAELPDTTARDDADSPSASPRTSTSVSRESSNASNSSTWSKGTRSSDSDATTPGISPVCTLQDILHSKHDQDDDSVISPKSQPLKTQRVMIGQNEMQTVHFDTRTWDDLLSS